MVRPKKTFRQAPTSVPPVRTTKGRHATTVPEVAGAPPVDPVRSVDGSVEVEAATVIDRHAPHPGKHEARSFGGHLPPGALDGLGAGGRTIDLRGPVWVSDRWVEGGHYYRQDVKNV